MKRAHVVLALIACACSSESKTSETAALPQTQPSTASANVVADSSRPAVNPCEHTGLWSECSLERRLKQSGFVVKKLDEKPLRAGFKIKPIVYSLGASRLEVFFYEDEKSASTELAQLDTISVAPKGSQATWPSTPTFIHSANLVAVLLTQNQRQSERVVLAITAGPPQPGSPR